MTIEYRLDRKRELRENLERLADEEAGLEQLAKDLDTFSQYKKAEAHLMAKGLKLVEQEDADEAKKYVDDLLEKTEKANLARTEKRKKQMKFSAKALGVAAGVLLAVYGISRIPQIREMHDREYQVQREMQHQEERKNEEDVRRYSQLVDNVKDAANIDCSGPDEVGRIRVSVEEFYKFYQSTTDESFPNQNLEKNVPVEFAISYTANSIQIESRHYMALGDSRFYQITLPSELAEQLQHTRSCSSHP